MTQKSSTSPTFSLNNKYSQDEGTIILSGLQALVRIPLDQHKADQAAGLNTATFISGYRGSPLGGYDFLLERNKGLLKEHEVTFVPGVNEDLAATAVLGSQIANLLPEPKYDGVLGIWYGKGPGVDRSGDIFKHAQTTGVGKNGGVLALAGDDPTAKSSTIPSHSEIALYDAQMPVLYPGNVQECIEFGRIGFEMSRYSGSWVGYKFVTNVADSFETATLRKLTFEKPEFSYLGRPWSPTQNPALLAPHSLNQEREIYEGRLEAARRFAAVNNVNQIIAKSNDDWIGIICSGKTYYDVMEAMYQLGLTGENLAKYGIRILKLGMIYPVEPTIIKTFAKGLEQIFVIEEKRAFVEMFVREILYNEVERPYIVGKKDENGDFLVRGDYELDADQITELLAKRLGQKLPAELFQSRLNQLVAPPTAINLAMSGDMPARTPYFCSGCPHNTSTVAPEGSLQGGGIGCSTLSILMDRNVTGVTQMGGEGAQWVGASPYTNVDHIFQHIGDGTLFHSGSLAIRQALASNASMTYKILYNGAVAMTGGQTADGEMDIPELTRLLESEGIVKTVVVSHDPAKFPTATNWAGGVEVWERDRLMEAQELLRDVEGITALIYDQPCATELRRERKRGKAVDPQLRVMINEEVCEGCGDCGEKSNCLSVFPVETELGRKTQIHQSSCNKDYSCLKGDCPAFVTVVPAEDQKAVHKVSGLPQGLREKLENLPEPRKLPPSEGNVYMTGIGGTGVVTINQILATAAMLDGKHVNSLDQTGLSQKGGPVVSHIRVTHDKRPMSCMVGKEEADAMIIFDMLSGTTEANLKKARKDHTVAIVSDSKIPTGTMVRNKAVKFPQNDLLRRRLETVTIAGQNIYFNAIETSEMLFGNHMQANIMTIGAAYQVGILPITAVAIEHAIELNGVAVTQNRQAFRIGRLIAINGGTLDLAIEEKEKAKNPPVLSDEAQKIINSVGADGELLRLLEIRVPELIAFQNGPYAQSYADFIAKTLTAEAGIGDGRLTESVARYLYKLMAYKDEYEVARLHLKSTFNDAITTEFGSKAKVKFMLHPPLLRALGMKKKLALGSWIRPFFRLLASMKGVRGTALDIFGKAEVRRQEQQLPQEYKSMIEEELKSLSSSSYNLAVELAETPDIIRGYEDIKMANIARYRTQVAELQAAKETVSSN